MAYAAARLIASRFPARQLRSVAVSPLFVPPDADRDARFEVQFLEDMLHVFLHSAGAAAQDLSDLGVALPGRDPFHHFELAFGQWPRLHGWAPGAIAWGKFFETPVPGGHGGEGH